MCISLLELKGWLLNPSPWSLIFFFFLNKVLSKNAVSAKKNERKHAGKGQCDNLKDMLLITH